jgi:hypothetical protein
MSLLRLVAAVAGALVATPVAILICLSGAWLLRLRQPFESRYREVLFDAILLSRPSLLIALAVIVVLGMPAALAFRRICWTRLWHFALLGAGLGVAFFAGVALLFTGRIDRIWSFWLCLGSVDGSLSSIAFWLVAVHSNPWRTDDERSYRGAA